jgi:hypothetical protein
MTQKEFEGGTSGCFEKLRTLLTVVTKGPERNEFPPFELL